jgi:chorismate mutase / prephenate dehydratase
MTSSTIDGLRAEIDALDATILKLLNQRMSLSRQIGQSKNSLGQCVFDPDREARVLARLIDLNDGPLPEISLRAIYREIFSGSRLLQEPITVAFLGPAGTYTHEAARERFGRSLPFIACESITEVFHEVGQSTAQYGVVPIENSIEGSVSETHDMLMTSTVGVCGEISIRISHTLMNLSGEMEDVKIVMSHPQALAQCRLWLARKLPGIPLQETSSTAAAAEKAGADSRVAAIASETLGTELGLKVLRKGIQDRQENITRFLVLGTLKPRRTGKDRTSIVFWTENEPGALFRILEKFSKRGINLSRIESRPEKGSMPWRYAFFVDLDGHRDDPEISECLEEIIRENSMVKVIGSFPKQTIPQ